MAAENFDSVGDSPEEQPVSLDQLSQTFAKLFAQAQTESPEPEPANSDDDDDVPATQQTPPALLQETWQGEPEPRDVSPKSIVEAMLFVGDPGNAPLTAEQAASVMRGVFPQEVHDAVRQLNEQYLEQQRPCHIVSDGAGYRLVLRPEYRRLRDKFQGKVRQARLSQAAIEVLALVAYREPISAEEITRQRGASSGGVLAQLVRRQLLLIERDGEHPREPRYRTTQRFLDLFGLETLADLPQSQEAGPG
jgi:segregation and condensation protein B